MLQRRAAGHAARKCNLMNLIARNHSGVIVPAMYCSPRPDAVRSTASVPGVDFGRAQHGDGGDKITRYEMTGNGCG
jgi:hypothetical protein